MLDTVDESSEDAEIQAYWAVVETATHVDSNDPALTSLLWNNVEQLMGCRRRLLSGCLISDGLLIVVVPSFPFLQGSVNEDQLRPRRQRQVWFTPFVDKHVCGK